MNRRRRRARHVRLTATVDATHTEQLVVVLTEGWDALKAQLCRLERRSGKWHRVASCTPAVVGKKGVAWGVGQRPAGRIEPLKQEGDGRAPAGVFPVVGLIGYDATAPKGATLRYRQATPTLHCVDDPASERYNQIVDAATLPQPLPWKSSELMKRKDKLYKTLAVVDYNSSPRTAGAGSCIFVHIWRSADKGTAGCTAMAETDLMALASWLRPEASPLIVVLPAPLYDSMAESWDLPTQAAWGE